MQDHRQRYDAALAALARTPLAIDRDYLARITGFLARGGSGQPRAGLLFGRRDTPRSGPIGVVPIVGYMEQHASFLTEILGGTSTSGIGQQVERLAADNSITGIVLWVDSGGGSVFGLEEAAAKIRAARSKKPVVAVADSVMASAAYYLASQARAVYSAPGALIGSVGTILVHETEPLKLKEELGIETTVITAGKYKAETEPSTSLTAEGQQHLQELIDGFYRDFIKAVAVGRGQPESVVTGPRFGQGRVFKDTEAVARGLADGVKTLERTIADMRGSKQPAAPAPPGDGTWQARMRRAQARARAVEVATRASEITDSPPRVARERRAIGL